MARSSVARPCFATSSISRRLAHQERRGLRLDVADALVRDADVGLDDGEDLAVHLAALEELHGRQAKPLLLDLCGVRREAARHRAADVGPVAGVLEPAEQRAIDEDGLGEAHVHQMRAAEIRVVDDVDVAGLRRARPALADQADQLRRRVLHRADEDRQAVLALRDERAGVGGVDAVRAVVGLGDDGGEGGAREGEVHLVADLLQAGLHHREGQGVQGAHALILRLPIASTTATAPGSITVVASICCTTAGPSMRASAGKASRA